MKNLRSIVAAILTLSLVQGLWAVAPGGTLGGGGKVSQGQPAQEGKLAAEPIVTVPLTDEKVLQGSDAESALVKEQVVKDEVVIGKKASEGQSNQVIDEKGFREAEVAHNSKKEARRNFKDMLKKLREARSNESPSSPLDDMLILCVILCFFLPPLAVYLYFNTVGTEFWISLLLTIFFWVPGVIYSLYVILTN